MRVGSSIWPTCVHEYEAMQPEWGWDHPWCLHEAMQPEWGWDHLWCLHEAMQPEWGWDHPWHLHEFGTVRTLHDDGTLDGDTRLGLGGGTVVKPAWWPLGKGGRGELIVFLGGCGLLVLRTLSLFPKDTFFHTLFQTWLSKCMPYFRPCEAW